MNLSQSLSMLLEEIAGAAAIVYHRTGASSFLDPTGKELSGKEIPENIIAQGFAEGKKGQYGAGIYATYRLNSQFRKSMEVYGEYLVKCRVNLQGYIILDYAEARKVSKEKYTLRDQLSQYYPTSWIEKELTWITSAHTQLQEHPQVTTSKIALELYQRGHIDRVVPGLLFTGAHDDAVVVTYNPQFIIPLAYAYHPVFQPVSAQSPVQWTPLDLATYRGHLRKVGSLIRMPPARETLDRSASSALFQKLAGHVPFGRKDVMRRLRKITSLSIEYKDIPSKPELEILPKSYITMMRKKFLHPEAEFYALIQPLLHQRLKSVAEDICWFLGSIPNDQDTEIDCQPTKRNTIQITFTFPTFQCLLSFLTQALEKDPSYIKFIVDFLRSDTKRTRGNLTRDIMNQLVHALHTSSEERYFSFPLRFYGEDVRALLWNAPSTK